jgi:hypothetical protein
MADHTPTTLTPNKVKKHTGAVKGLDNIDPNDMAFKLVTMFVFIVS